MFGWINHPGPLNTTQRIAATVVFSASILATNYALAPFPNIKLMDALVFTSAFLFGLKVGVSVATLSWLIYGNLNPYGGAGYILPALIGGESLYAIAGYLMAKTWSMTSSAFSSRNLVLGSAGIICTFIYDLETNLFTALIANVPVIPILILGIPFAIVHQISNFVFFSTIVPLLILAIGRTSANNIIQMKHKLWKS